MKDKIFSSYQPIFSEKDNSFETYYLFQLFIVCFMHQWVAPICNSDMPITAKCESV